MGGRVQLTGKTSVDAFVTRADLKYDADAFFLGSNLAQVLNHDDSSEGITVRYAATNLTKIAVETVEKQGALRGRARPRFRRVADHAFSRVQPVRPREWPRRFRVLQAQICDRRRAATGSSVLVDLSYTLLGRTRFTIGATRKPEYSYLPGVRDYVEASITGSVTQRLGDSWDVVGRLGRSTLRYDQGTASGDAVVVQTPNETVMTFGADLGYSVRHTRIGAYLQHDQRYTELSAAQSREYQRLRIGSSVTYVF